MLESVLALADNEIRKLKFKSKRTDVSTAVFMSEEFAEDDVKSFLLKILVAEHRREPFHFEEEILSWIQKQGLCNKNLPSFFGGKIFDLLNECCAW